MHSLPLFHRISGRPVIVAGEGDMGEAKARLVERAGGLVVGPDNIEARLAFVAMEEPDALAAAFKARGLLVNVADRPDLCDFTLPSVLERRPVLVAVSTGGASAGLAKVLRLRLEALLPASLGLLAEALSGARAAMRARCSDPGERRCALDAALAEGGPLDPLAPHGEGAGGNWLSGGATGEGGMAEFTLTSDDPDDLTLRQARWLGSADRVFYAPGVPPAILTRARADAVQRELDGEPPARADGLTVIIRRD